MKTCNGCGEAKPLDAFGPLKSGLRVIHASENLAKSNRWHGEDHI